MASDIVLKNNLDTELRITHINDKPAKSLDSNDLTYTRATVADMEAISNPQDGDVCFVKDLDRGGSFIYDSSEVSNDNQGTNFNGWIRQYSGAVNVKWFGAKSITEIGYESYDSTSVIQNALTVATGGALFFPSGTYLISSTLTVTNKTTIFSNREFGGALIIGDIDGGLLANTSTQWWLVSFNNMSFKNQYNSANASCLKATMYRCKIQNCNFTCKYGKAINLLGNDYAVENVVEKNYFYGCKYGIYAETNTNSNTDSWIVDNYFWKGDGDSETTIENSIYWHTASGCVFRGNHFYGSSETGMLRIVLGLNVSISGNYFEYSTNPRLRIQGGNPSSFSVVGNSFWTKSDYNTTDSDGDTSSLIKLTYSQYNPFSMGLSGNTFHNDNTGSGTINCQIFSHTNLAADTANKVKIYFDDSNALLGSFTLQDKSTTGTTETATGRHAVISYKSEFDLVNTDATPSIPGLQSFVVYLKGDGSGGTKYPTLYTNKNWLTDKKIKIYNISRISTSTTYSFSTGASGGITGSEASSNNVISPGGIVELSLVDGNYFFNHIKV